MNKQTQYLLASIVESSQDSIVSIDLNRNVTSWNIGAENLYGYKREEVIGKPLELVMLPADIAELIKKVDSIVHEVTVPIYETVRIHKNGRHADLEILLSPVRNSNGQVIGVSTIARDITLRKMQEQQKDEFIAIASHELKSPVTSLKAYTEIVLEQLENVGDQLSASMVRKLDGQVDRLIGLINTLLDTTRLTAGELLLNKEYFDLNTLIAEQVEALRLQPGNHKINFEAGDIQPVHADRKFIGQAIANLISNAIKYSPGSVLVNITSREVNGEIEVSVQDFGVGIPQTAKDKVFDRYFRARHPTNTTFQGVGLGLYITAEIIRQHNGTISVQSEEGIGSTFFFTLPL